ncbi:hypothetical protein BDN67DRAFT_992893 [Paxillus ammoniavirescens]|nr:hypothetical protein BDN67DRAFT_992893 [Paxillus ammoniavirescens]
MRYREEHTQKVFEELAANGGTLQEYTDFFDGSDYLEAVQQGKIGENDIVLMMSVDESDCWVAIWVILDRSPDTHYKKKYVLPACIIPGPKKPKNLDSFMFPGFYHLAAIQKEGLKIWDADRNITFVSHPFLALGTADRPGLAYLNGLVGHHGKNGCRLYCGLKGWHKAGVGIYYPVLLKPHGFNVAGCDHEDVEAHKIKSSSPQIYMSNLQYLLQSRNETQYKLRRLETGISKPRTFECDANDNKSTWWWATLVGEVWKTLGKDTADTRSHLPGSYDRPPRNIAEKINSGYKAWEFWIFLTSLGPTQRCQEIRGSLLQLSMAP